MDKTGDVVAAPRHQELQEQIRRRREALLDLEEERRFTLGQTGVHLGASRVASLRAAWDRDEARLREEIAALEAALAESEVASGD